MNKNKDVILITVFGIILIISFYLDGFVKQNFTSPGLFSTIGYWGVFALMAIILVYVFTEKRKSFAALISGYAITALITYFIKLLILRPRPYGNLLDPSFPSLHASLAFLAIPFLEKNWKVFVTAMAVLIAFSRIVAGEHYLSDIVAGAILGYLVGILCYDERGKIRHLLIPFSTKNIK